MTQPHQIVFVVDDDASVRRSLARLFKSAGYQVQTFASAEEFLANGAHQSTSGPACLVADLRMPGLTGMDLQAQLAALNSPLAIIVITAHGDIPTTVRAMKAGAVDFFPKPFDDTELLEAVARAMERSRQDHRSLAELTALQKRFATLTVREREVMGHIVTGRLNKQVADDLGIVEKTIKVHRARVFEKMQVQSLAELIPLAEKLGLLASK